MSTIDCKALAPTWETLAQDFITEPNVVIAKVDAEAENSKATASEQGVTSYPTIKFFAKGSTEGEAYTGGRTEKELIDFINEKAGTHRVPGGGLDTKGGTIDILNHIALRYAAGTDRLNDLLNGAADKLADELGISQWYSFHVMNVCQGDFAPNVTVSGAWYNTTNCTAREPGGT